MATTYDAAGRQQPRSRRKLAASFASNIVLLIFLGFVLLPVIWVVLTAFKNPAQAYEEPPAWAFHPTLLNFRVLFQSQFLADLGHSAILMVLSTAVALILGVPAGYSLARANIRGKGFMTSWLVIAYVTPVIVFIIPLYVEYLRLGISGSYLALVLSYEIGLLPFTIFMMRSYFADLPVQLEEAAMIDGCSRARALRLVVLPVMWPAIVTVGILVAIASWGEYFVALVLTDQTTTTAPVAIYTFVGIEASNWGAMAAGSLLVILPVLILAVFIQRGLIRGLTSGAVK
jgi:multiple sugar transport system permease protein